MADIAAGAAANLASDATRGIFDEIIRHLKYVIKYKEYVDKFERKLSILKAKGESVQQEVDAAGRNGEKIKADVELWRTTVDKVIGEEEKKVKDLEDKEFSNCSIGFCPDIKSRYQLSRTAEQGLVALDNLIRRCQFNGVGYRDLPEAVLDASPKGFETFKSREKVFKDIMEAIADGATSVIGVYGLAGMGKTSLVKEVARQVQNLTLFDSVVIVKVTETPDIQNIQDQIAESLGLTLEKRCTVVRARRLCERLKKEKKVLVVLDNIWKRLDLEEVGIPFGNQHKGCKLLMTSRDQNVLSNGMDAEKTFPIGDLDDEEAWDLFRKMAGDSVESAELRPTAIEVAKKCARLPLAIAAVARALKNKSLYAWEDALRQLQRPSSTNFKGISAAVYSAIELSYNQLESEEIKQVFLLCNLVRGYPITDLLKYAFGLGLIDGVNTVEEARNRLLTMVSNLKASGLLIDSNINDRYFDMHDLVYEVAMSIASKDNQVFALKEKDVLKDWPDGETMKTWNKIHLDYPSIIGELPNHLNCPQLVLLYISSEDSSLKVPPNFFRETTNLKVLDLTKIHFSSLPSSIRLLTSLRTLCLDQCELEDIAIIGELRNLEVLSLLKSVFKILPKEIGLLDKLKLLDLSHCTKLKTIPRGVLSRLSRLEELYMGGTSIQWEVGGQANQGSNASLDELKTLSCLTILEVHIPDAEAMLGSSLFNHLQKLKRYKIFIGDEWKWFGEYEHSRILKLKLSTSIHHLDHGIKMLLKKTEALYLDELQGVEIAMKELKDEGSLPHLKNLHIQNGSTIKYIIHDDHAVDKKEFVELRSLTLENLPQLISFCSQDKGDSASLPLFGGKMLFPCLENLRLSSINVERIWHIQLSNTSVRNHENLTRLVIEGCANLRQLLSFSMAMRLVHLKYFEIIGCESLREIIFAEDIQEESEAKILFPQLNSLNLQDLEHLVGFCLEDWNIEFPTLKSLKINKCPEMKAFIYKSAMEDSESFSNQVLFDKKIVCPNLENVELSSIDVQRIWDDQLFKMSSCVSNLKSLIVKGCHNLRWLFSSSKMQHCVQLEDIQIYDCKNLEEVIFMEGSAKDGMMSQIFFKLEYLLFDDLPKLLRFCHGSYLEFSSLKLLRIVNCPALRTLISDSTLTNEAKGNNSDVDSPLLSEKVAFPQLEGLRIMSMENCRKIWPTQLIGDSFGKLNILWVFQCKSLLNIFPPSMRTRLQNLKEFRVRGCHSVEEIFESEELNASEFHAVTISKSMVKETTTSFVFPKLTYLELRWLSKLKSFYSRRHTTEWPLLKKMVVFGCDKVEIFASESMSFGESTNEQALFRVNEVTFPGLEELKLEWNDIMREIWHGQLRAEFFCKLKVLELIRFPDESADFPYCFIQSLPYLEKLVISEAPFSQIFQLEGFDGDKNHASAITSLKELELSKLPELTYLWKEEYHPIPFSELRTLKVMDCGILKILVPSSVSFENLATLEVSRCHGVVNLITCSAAKSLVQLKRMTITDCEMIETIIACESDEVKGGIVFPQLKYLQLSSLPTLESFCLGDHNFEFPTLKKKIERECPKMKIFCQGELSTPQLQKVI